jgi:DNA (cytosine-5)-methyltransferase 1
MAIVHRNTVNPMRHNEPTRPIAVDLFAGAGGMSLGFEQAGFRVAAAVEIDPIHACVHKFNFPDCTVIPRSVRDLTGQMIRETAGIRGKVEVVCGGAPCQGFSLIGKRILDDPRNSLVKDFVRIVSELDAEYFVFENVKGLTVGTHRRFLDELIESFEEIGYSVRLPWAVLNAVSYGVPQDRKRLFLLGSKKGNRIPFYPEATTSHPGRHPEACLMTGPTCIDALHDLPDADRFSILRNTDEVAGNRRLWQGEIQIQACRHQPHHAQRKTACHQDSRHHTGDHRDPFPFRRAGAARSCPIQPLGGHLSRHHRLLAVKPLIRKCH